MSRGKTAEKTPGLTERTRRNGSTVWYWTAKRELIKIGYTPKMVRLHGDMDVISARCHALQAEMLQWSVSHKAGTRKLDYDGTFESLVRYYKQHPDSPFQELRQKPAANYSYVMKRLMEAKGKRRVDKTTATDIKRWYKELTEATSKSTAAYTMRVLRAIISFGVTQRFEDCKVLRPELRYVSMPAGASRKEFLTYGQVLKFRDAARVLSKEIGRDLTWMVLCLLFQFEFALRRRDVIGEWVWCEPGTDGIRGGRARHRIWQDGVTWANIDGDGVFSKLISKTRDTSEEVAVHYLSDYPLLKEELGRIPADRRIGPIVVHDTTGTPPTETECRRWFRRIARKAGIPDKIWNMDARAGANSEAREAGATADEAMALLTHTEARTNEGYDRVKLGRSSSAAKKRQASRTK